MKIIIPPLIVLAIMSSLCKAQTPNLEWRFVGDTSEHHVYHFSRTQTAGEILLVLQRYVLKSAALRAAVLGDWGNQELERGEKLDVATQGWSEYTEHQMTIGIDCKRRRLKILEVDFYAASKLLKKLVIKDGTWDVVEPKSIGDTTINAACTNNLSAELRTELSNTATISARAAIKSMKGLATAVEVGINRIDYGRRLIDVKITVG